MNVIKIAYAIFLLFFCTSVSQAQNVQIPEIGAFLPSITKVKPGAVSAVDGLWSISSLDKIVRIDRGRIYAIEGWNHLFVLKIKPGMVVVTSFKEIEPGVFDGEDLPLQGPLVAQLTGDRILDVVVQGALGEVTYQLIPSQLDDPAAFNKLVKEVRAQGS